MQTTPYRVQETLAEALAKRSNSFGQTLEISFQAMFDRLAILQAEFAHSFFGKISKTFYT